MRKLLLALDQGTSSSRAILFDEGGAIAGSGQKELTQIYPRPGWVEHDPREIWASQAAAMWEVIAAAGERFGEIAAIGVTNQRETTVLWDRQTGEPVHNAIVWQDRRTADFCSALKRDGRAAVIQAKTGLIPDAYFSASKLAWLLDNVPGVRERAGRGELAFGTVDSWLIYNLTRDGAAREGGMHVTDMSNASRTMLFNIHTCQWDEELLKMFNVPREVLPEVRGSAGQFGETRMLTPALPITGVAGDQQAALFGQACLSPGLAKNTYGTGCFLLMNTGSHAAISKHKLLTTIAWGFSDGAGAVEYALEGSVFVGGAVVQWLRDGLGIIQSASEIEALARTVGDNGGVYLVPAFAGLGAPHWDQYARGTIAGITRGTTKGHLARAAIESIAFQVADLLEVMRADSGTEIPELRVDGGAAGNDLLLQFQADLLRVPVVRPKVTETTALGAALLAGLGAGLWKKPEEMGKLWQPAGRFEPRMPAEEAARLRRRWNAALSRARDWEEPA